MSRYTTKPGATVWVVQSANQETVYAHGLGTYLGDQPLPGDMGPLGATFAEMEPVLRQKVIAEDANPAAFEIGLLEHFAAIGEITPQEAGERIVAAIAEAMAERSRPIEVRVWEHWRRLCNNPKILLADGTTVWGCESWWGPGGVATARAYVAGRAVVVVPGSGRDRALPAGPA